MKQFVEVEFYQLIPCNFMVHVPRRIVYLLSLSKDKRLSPFFKWEDKGLMKIDYNIYVNWSNLVNPINQLTKTLIAPNSYQLLIRIFLNSESNFEWEKVIRFEPLEEWDQPGSCYLSKSFDGWWISLSSKDSITIRCEWEWPRCSKWE